MSALTDIAWSNGDFVLDAGGHPALATGTDVVRQDLLARLHCPPGSHWAYPEEGVDLTQYVQGTTDSLTLLALRQDTEIGVEQDTRVLLAEAELDTLDLRRARLTVRATLTDGALVQLFTPLGGSRG